MDQEIIEAQPQAVVQANAFNVEALISEAIKQGTPVDTMERILAMRRELKAEFAKEAFDRAMAKFQAECPVIEKKKKVAFNTTNYSYAPLDEIVGQVKSIISGNGFSYTFDTEQTDRAIKVFCKVKHELGHSESSKFEIEIDTAAKMNRSQQYGSALTYGKRYAFCDAFGILTGDEDDDAISSGGGHKQAKQATPAKQPKVSDSQLKMIKSLADQKGYVKDDVVAICKEMGFSTLTGGKDGSASKVIDWLLKAPSKQEPQTIEDVDPEMQKIAENIEY